MGACSAHRDGVDLQVAEVLDDPVAAFPRLCAPNTCPLGETEVARREQPGAGKGQPPRLRDTDGLGVWGHARRRRAPSSRLTRGRTGSWPLTVDGDILTCMPVAGVEAVYITTTEGRPHVAVERRGAGAPRALGCRTGHRTDLA